MDEKEKTNPMIPGSSTSANVDDSSSPTEDVIVSSERVNDSPPPAGDGIVSSEQVNKSSSPTEDGTVTSEQVNEGSSPAEHGLVTSKQVNEGSSPAEDGLNDSLVSSERMVEELMQQPLVEGIDEHLMEFSETLRTVAKALRKLSDGKATAKAEAAEWKRKYKLEKARNIRSEREGWQPGESSGTKDGDLNDQIALSDTSSDQCELCTDEVLRDSESDRVIPNKMKKASFKLSWYCKGEKSDRHKHDVVSFEKGNITTAERSSKQISLTWESPPRTVLILTKPNSYTVQVLTFEMIRWLKDRKKINIYVEPRVKHELLAESPYFRFVETWTDDSEVLLLHTKVDLIITLGGDGTVLWAASMFKGPVPPIVPFSLGSLGFMTPFHSERYHEYLTSLLQGPISITLRHRLQCHIIPDAAKSEYENDGPMLVLNEVTIDRGMSSFLTNLECYCDNSFVTCVQGDGLIISTTSGSTAYSLAAGGSMVHPQVPGILFTPICPHSLSFRPLILPEYVTLRVLVPFNSRSHAWVSFDGKGRRQLGPGDALVCSMAPWPVPTACQVDSTSDFLHSIHEGLHWNLRKPQNSDGPRDPANQRE